MAIEALIPRRMSWRQGVNTGFTVTGDALTELRDLNMPVISRDLGYFSIQAWNDKDREYGKECRSDKGGPLYDSDPTPSSSASSLNSFRVGRSDMSLRPKYCKNSFVVAYRIGLPGTSFLPIIFTNRLSRRPLITPAESTPRISSISAFTRGCL